MSRFAKLAMTLMVALSTMAATLVTTGSPAAAATGNCESGYFCVWTDSPYTGVFKETKGAINNVNSWDSRLTGKITDVWNRTGKPWCMYSSTSYLGNSVWYNNGYHDYTYGFNDKAWSLRPVPNPSSLRC